MRLWRLLRIDGHLDLVLAASLILPVTVVAQSPARSMVGVGVTLSGLLVPRLRRHAAFWGAAALLYGAWYWADWQQLDNHMWLLPVWFLAVSTSLIGHPPLELMTRQVRLLLVVVFGAALGWKIRSPDFASGGFFEFTILTDPRFEPLARLVGVDSEMLVSNRLLVASGPQASVLDGASSVGGVADLLTLGTFAVEAAVLGTWLSSSTPTWARHAALGMFCVTAYAVAPVAGFGLTLLAMGAATTTTVSGVKRYLIGMTVLFVWSVVWNAIVL